MANDSVYLSMAFERATASYSCARDKKNCYSIWFPMYLQEEAANAKQQPTRNFLLQHDKNDTSNFAKFLRGSLKAD